MSEIALGVFTWYNYSMESRKAPTVSRWGMCPVCLKERHLSGDGALEYHRRYDTTYRKMVSCEGTGKVIK